MTITEAMLDQVGLGEIQGLFVMKCYECGEVDTEFYTDEYSLLRKNIEREGKWKWVKDRKFRHTVCPAPPLVKIKF